MGGGGGGGGWEGGGPPDYIPVVVEDWARSLALELLTRVIA